jgi:hypothetical protein
MAGEARRRWFAELIAAGLGERVFEPSDLLQHATPEVLASCLPSELLATVLSSALSAGAMTAERVLETLTPELCAEHLPHDVLWACVAAAAGRSGIAEGNGGAPTTDKRRVFLRRALHVGLGELVLSADDLLRFATPQVLATHLPIELKAKLLSQALRADAMNPPLVVEALGVEGLAAHLPMAVIWRALEAAGARAVAADPASKVSAPASSASSAQRSRPRPSAPRPLGPAKSPVGSGSKRPTATAPRPDTEGGQWTDADVLEMVEEEPVDAVLEALLGQGRPPGAGEWPEEETNVGVDTPSHK